MSKDEKGFAFLVPLVVIIVLAILGIAAYFTYQKAQDFSGTQKQVDATPPPTTENQTANPQIQQNTNTQNIITPEQSCTNSGGIVSDTICYCSGTPDFYNNCAIGGCTCTPNPSAKRQIKNCNCGQGKCFNGTSCVSQVD